jgi:uncharacterized protein (DUF488 family)
MKISLFTIGFTGKSAEEFFGLLVSAAVTKVVDVRESRIGQLSGFAKFPDIAYFLDRLLRVQYSHEPRFAPTPEIRDRYRTTENWGEYERAFHVLMQERKLPRGIDLAEYQGNVALLCSEPTAEKCHRRLIAEMLQEHWTADGHDVELRHLTTTQKKRSGKKRAKALDGGSHHL